MSERNMNSDELYGIVLTGHQQILLTEIKPGEEVFGCARRNIGCEWIELVDLDDVGQVPLVLLIDEMGKLKDGEKLVNAVGSYLFKSHEHGDVIIGNAMLVKRGEDELHMLTSDEAKRVIDRLYEMELPALETISRLLGIPPKETRPIHRTSSISEELKKHSEPRRQSGKNIEKER